MNNSFARLVQGMSRQLRHEVLPLLGDEYARSQLWAVVNALNTFAVRADWSAGFLLEQLQAQHRALALAAEVLREPQPMPVPAVVPVAELLAARDAGNRAIGALLERLEGPERLESRAAAGVDAAQAATVIAALREAMRAEFAIELKHSPRPLFSEMSGG